MNLNSEQIDLLTGQFKISCLLIDSFAPVLIKLKKSKHTVAVDIGFIKEIT